jgi:hypothetical protein
MQLKAKRLLDLFTQGLRCSALADRGGYARATRLALCKNLPRNRFTCNCMLTD